MHWFVSHCHFSLLFKPLKMKQVDFGGVALHLNMQIAFLFAGCETSYKTINFRVLTVALLSALCHTLLIIFR